MICMLLLMHEMWFSCREENLHFLILRELRMSAIALMKTDLIENLKSNLSI